MRKIIFILFAATLLMQFGCGGEDTGDTVTNPIPATFPLKKTGQTREYYYFYDDYYDIGVAPSYTRDSETGIVTDHVTGIMWQDNVLSPAMNWATAVETCESLSLGGYDDWRLPIIEELESIVDYGRSSLAVDPIFVNTAEKTYWSYTTYTAYTPSIWSINYSHGSTNYLSASNNYYVMCVRGAAYPDADFVRDSATQIVTDNRTGLMWQDDTVSSMMDWFEALIYCYDKRQGGYTDWRLPNIRELLSINDRSRYNTAINPAFVNTNSEFYWSSTTYSHDTYKSFVVSFLRGSLNVGNKVMNIYYARCVRGGQ